MHTTCVKLNNHIPSPYNPIDSDTTHLPNHHGGTATKKVPKATLSTSAVAPTATLPVVRGSKDDMAIGLDMLKEIKILVAKATDANSMDEEHVPGADKN